MKKCYVCKKEKPLDEFYNCKSSKDGKGPKCSECNREESRKWRKNNPDKYNAQGRKYHQKHKVRIAERKHKYHRENPHILLAAHQKYQARKRGATVEDVDYSLVLKRDGYRCYLCEETIDSNGKYPHPDSVSYEHVIPLSKGGEHSYANIRVAHWGCNNGKNSRPAEEYIRRW